jgi:N-acetylmuramoyl-L-alanine amidase
MRRILLVLLVLLLPVAVFAAMVLADRSFGRPGRGFDYVVKVDLPAPEALAALPKIEGPLDASRPLVVIDAGCGTGRNPRKGFDPGPGQGAAR